MAHRNATKFITIIVYAVHFIALCCVDGEFMNGNPDFNVNATSIYWRFQLSSIQDCIRGFVALHDSLFSDKLATTMHFDTLLVLASEQRNCWAVEM